VSVDTTAQTKAVAHPTDSHLLLRAIEWLNKLAKKHGIGLRQSYLRLATRARREVGRLIHGRGHKQAMRYLRKMRTWTGRVVRDIERKIEGQPDVRRACEPKLHRVKQFLAQKPDDKNKIKSPSNPAIQFGQNITVQSNITAACGTWNTTKIEYDLDTLMLHGKMVSDHDGNLRGPAGNRHVMSSRI
jgi:hypothetical protein